MIGESQRMADCSEKNMFPRRPRCPPEKRDASSIIKDTSLKGEI